MVKASLIWLNYNSLGFMDIALKSIESVLNLDFDDYEVIVVDNASSDGSFEKIKEFVEEKRPSSVRVKFVRSNANRGYAGGMNLGWEAKDPKAKYVAFLNNDLIVEPNSLRELVDYMESDEKLAAASGLIYSSYGKIYSAGGYGAENWVFGGICRGISEDECLGVDKRHYVTYADGAYMVVKADVIKETCPEGKPFIDETFLYLDDGLLGLMLWNKGYKVAYAPVKSGFHYSSLTTSRHGIQLYYAYRGSTVMMNITKTRLNPLKHLYITRRLIGYLLLSLVKSQKQKDYVTIINVTVNGLRFTRFIRNKVGVIELKKAPYVPMSIIDVINDLIFSKKIGKITFEMLKQTKTDR